MSTESEVEKVKIVLVGESGVGKTNILSQYVRHHFDINSMATDSATQEGKTIRYEENNISLQMELWDTAGQEKFRSIARIFYKDATAAILVYDISRKESFEAIKNYWHQEILDKAPEGVVLGIAANKADLFMKAQVSENEGREFARKVGAIFRQTSAFTSDGIDDLFYVIGKKIIDPKYIDEDEIISNSIKENKENNDNQEEAPKPVRKTVNNNLRDSVRLDTKKNNEKKVKKKCC